MKTAFCGDQRFRACRALLAAGGIERMWTERGPTAEAREQLANDGACLPRGERALLLAASAFWTGEPSSLRLDDLVDLPEAEAIFKLAIASLYGSGAVEVWLTRPHFERYVGRTNAEVHAAAAQLYDEARAVFAEHRDQPMNLNAAPDACALGAMQMADYAMIVGLPILKDDVQRHAEATRRTVKMLGMFAAMAHMRATDRDDDNGENEP